MRILNIGFATFLCFWGTLEVQRSFAEGEPKGHVVACDQHKLESNATLALEETRKLSVEFNQQSIARLVEARNALLKSESAECKALALTIQDVVNMVLVSELAKQRADSIDKEALNSLERSSQMSAMGWDDLRRILPSMKGTLPGKLRGPLQDPGFDRNEFRRKLLEVVLQPESSEKWTVARQSAENPALLHSEFLRTSEQRENYVLALAVEVTQHSESRQAIIQAAKRLSKPASSLGTDLNSELPKGFDLMGIPYSPDQTLDVLSTHAFEGPALEDQVLLRLRPFLSPGSVEVPKGRLPKKLEWGFLLPK